MVEVWKRLFLKLAKTKFIKKSQGPPHIQVQRWKNDEDAYDRIFTTDDDKTMLERWNESKNMIAGSLKSY